MKAPVDEFASIVDRLATRLEELERRVAALEHPSPAHPQATAALPAAITPQGHPLAQIGSSFNGMPVIGKVFLGLAGAYLLRALAELGSIPKWPVACVALVYAGLWLLWAARTASKVAFASAAYATTAAVILLPMLWELTLRFNVMPARFTAAVLVVFVAAASGLAWKSRSSAVVWSPAAFASVAAVVLLLSTRDPFPFTLALLLMALMTEAAASTGRWLSLRPWVAVPADLAVLAMIVLYTGRDGLSPEYKPVAAEDLLALSAGLFVIYAASVLSRTLALRRKISVFEIGQTVAAFLLASFGVLRTTHHAAAPALGVFCLLAAAACYWLAFARFENTNLLRNQHVFSTWAIALAWREASFVFRCTRMRFGLDLRPPWRLLPGCAPRVSRWPFTVRFTLRPWRWFPDCCSTAAHCSPVNHPGLGAGQSGHRACSSRAAMPWPGVG
jgi:hypothetical protein